jgi:hypothetical protein
MGRVDASEPSSSRPQRCVATVALVTVACTLLVMSLGEPAAAWRAVWGLAGAVGGEKILFDPDSPVVNSGDFGAIHGDDNVTYDWWAKSKNATTQWTPAKIVRDKELPPTALVRDFFKNILVLMMMSPGRYHLIDTVKRHYEPFFTHMYFCGPHNDTNYSVPVHGYDIVWGNEQYRAVSRIIRKIERERPIAKLEGYFYISDDVIIQPWAMLSFNKSIIWATQMGIANVKSGKIAKPVPGMSMEARFRKDWPYWKKNRGKLMQALHDGGEAWAVNLRASARRESPWIYKWSAYPGNLMTHDDLGSAVFYTIVDTYYVPKRFALAYADRCDIMEKRWVFGECAIPTALRSIDPEYELMHVQFYWSTLNASDCPRRGWGPQFTGFHRCRHDHFFAEALYNETTRNSMVRSPEYRRAMILARKPVKPPAPTHVPTVSPRSADGL